MSTNGNSLKKNMVSLGIDYGTTKTVVSYCTRDNASSQLLLLGRRGSSNVPTCIYFPVNAGSPVIGDKAEQKGREDCTRYADDIKMQLSSDRILLSFDGKDYTAADLTELYLKEIWKRCSSYYQVANVVITHPAQGNPTRDARLKQAALNAGFSDVEFITEPEAAAYAYFKQNPSQIHHALVVDWGGGTLDMTLVSIEGQITRTYPDFTRGWSENLGGVDIDNMLFEYVGELMMQQGMGEAWAQDVMDYTWLLTITENIRDAKIALSDASLVSFPLSLKRPNGESYPLLELKRTAYIDLIKRDVLDNAAEKAADLVREIKSAGITPEIILLFGGTSLIPEVAEYMCRETGLQCTPWSNAKEAVSLGAALKAREKWIPIQKENIKPKLAKFRILKFGCLGIVWGFALFVIVMTIIAFIVYYPW